MFQNKILFVMDNEGQNLPAGTNSELAMYLNACKCADDPYLHW